MIHDRPGDPAADLERLIDETPLAAITLGNVRELLKQTDRANRIEWWIDRVLVPILIVVLAVIVAVIVLGAAQGIR